MVDTRLLVRIDAFLALFALLLVLATFYLVVRAPLVGLSALVVLALGLYALGSYVSGFLDGVGGTDGARDGNADQDGDGEQDGDGKRDGSEKRDWDGGGVGTPAGPEADARE